jgi:hypothetical protein
MLHKTLDMAAYSRICVEHSFMPHRHSEDLSRPRKYAYPIQVRFAEGDRIRLKNIAKKYQVRLIDVIRILVSNSLDSAERKGIQLKTSQNLRQVASAK